MLEILVISLLLGIWLASIFQAANHAKASNERIVQSIIANQIATEWVEVLYQFRNTNFLKHERQDLNLQDRWSNLGTRSWNECRLALDYRTWDTCEERLWVWYYYIDTTNWINTIIKCDEDCNNTWWDNISNENNMSAVNIIDDRYAICLTGWVRTPCPEWHETGWDQSKYWKFYRTIRGVWLYDMANNDTWWKLLEDIEPKAIAWIDAQEYRFCSMVARKWWQNWEIEICSTMTNFIK